VSSYALGLDYGTNSCRAVVLDLTSGDCVGDAVYDYPSGELGVLLDARDPNVARQNPADYVAGIEVSVRLALEGAGIDADQVVGIGVDTTGSTPIPVDARCQPLAFDAAWTDDLAAQAWLWKDHSSHAEAEEITELARRDRPEYVATCGGVYSSEWFWSKALHLCRTAPEVFGAMHSFVELCDFVPAVLAGIEDPAQIRRSQCAAGHKAMFNPNWGGLPDAEFLAALDPRLAALRGRLYDETFTADQVAGRLTAEWSERLGLSKGIPIAVGAFDAHMGAVGAGVAPGVLVKILGTSTCDILVSPSDEDLDVEGICGVVDGSVLPGMHGIEAGQSAVGDIFLWFARHHAPGDGELDARFAQLELDASKQQPGAHGLVALDWHNGNRTVLVDPLLSGAIFGQSLATTSADIYRALIEATAFGALKIIERLEGSGVEVNDVVTCGGLSCKSSLLMQIYADVTGRNMSVSATEQTCAAGAAIFGGVAAGVASIAALQSRVARLDAKVFRPDPKRHEVYRELYAIYSELHDAFGTREGAMGDVMKRLIAIRQETGGAK
jgi:L-ribulokinase